MRHGADAEDPRQPPTGTEALYPVVSSKFIFSRTPQDRKYGSALVDSQGKKIELNEASAAVLAACDGTRRVDQIVAQLTAVFAGTAPQDILSRLQTLLVSLQEQGALEFLSAPVSGPVRRMLPAPAPGPHQLLSLFVEITDACNLSCRHCYLGEMPDSRSIPFPDLQRLLEEFADLGGMFVTFSGGEPFVRSDVLDLVDYASSLPLFVILLSNGILIDDEAAARLARGNVHEVQISLDGARPATHDEFRDQPGAHAASVRAIEALRRQGIRVEISTVINRLNAGELADLVDLCAQWDAVPGFSPQQAKGRALAEGRRYQLTLHEYNQALLEAHAHIRAVTDQDPFCQRIPAEMNLQAGRCSAGLTSLAVRANGDILGCRFATEPLAVLGSIYAQSLGAVWNSDHSFLNRLRRTTLQDLAFCGECRHFPYCHGGCPVAAYEAFGDLDMPDPKYCSYFTLARDRLSVETGDEADDVVQTVIRCDQ